MIQNLLILKKGIPGFVYAQLSVETEELDTPTVIIEEVTE